MNSNETPASGPAAAPVKPHRWRWLRRILLSLVLLLAVAAGVLAWVVPDKAREAAHDWARGIGRELTIGKLDINPLTMTATLSNVKLAEGNGQPLFAAKEVLLEATPRSLLLGRWHAAELRLVGPKVAVVRDKGGVWNWARFIHDASGPEKPQPKEANKELPKVIVDLIDIQKGEVSYRDELAAPGVVNTLSPIQFKLTNLTTLPANGAYQLAAELMDGAKLNWRGDLRLQPLTSKGKLTLDGLQMGTVWPFAKPFLTLSAPPKGQVSAAASYAFSLAGAKPELKIAPFAAQLKQLELSAPQTREPLTLAELSVSGGRFDLDKQAVDIDQVRLANARLNARRGREGQIDWLSALPKQENAKPTPPSPWRVKVKSLQLTGLNGEMVDEGFATPLSAKYTVDKVEAGFAMAPDSGWQIDGLTVAVSNVAVASGNGAPLATVRRVELAPSEVSAAKHAVKLGKVLVDGIEASAERDRAGKINWLQALSPAGGAAKPAPAKSGEPGWKVSPPPLTLSDSRLSWRDASLPRPVTLTLQDLGGDLTAQDNGGVAGRLAGKLGSGQLGVDVTLPESGEGRYVIRANAVPLVPVAPYLVSGTPLRLTSGTASANLDVRQAKDGIGVSGDARINKLVVYEPGRSDPLIAWRELAALGLTVNAGKTLSANIRELRLIDPRARLILNEQRQLNIVTLFSKPGPPVTKSAPSGPTPVVDVRSVTVKNGELDFADLSMQPQFGTRVHNLKGTVQGLSTRPGRRGTITLDGDVDQYGDLRVRGVLAPLAVTSDTDISMRFRNIPMGGLNPYTTTFAGWQVKDGRLSADLRYKINQRQLDSQNQVVINSIVLGDEVPNYKGTHVPLKLAVALLEDSDGRIDLDLPVKGSLDDPQFSYGHLVWQAITNVIKKVVTAPFRALGALFGSEGFDAVYFVPGEATVQPPEREKLDKIAQVLAKRPKAAIEISGTYDPDTEQKALARARINKAIFAKAGRKLAADDPLPIPDMEDPDIQSAVRSVFGQRMGYAKLAARMVGGESGAARYRAMHKEMVEAEKIDDASLKALADARAKATRAALVSADASLAPRLTIGAAHADKAGKEGVPIGLKMSVQAAATPAASAPASAAH
ncbi:DUF748 domain-containing protein [Crenobacter sp. SG2305]|uniref:DUF748 domain-containing protein n=1 Tax=Crenobacter oryzisoli TaxID=3056844 RepID=UPI0025AB587F|nr:DUF748 domain-containing protein [Crenobacter sp. SG2305]MDN0084844.1 DUF748 domain-containing protein [Crenobacter sp. SG2305]